MFFFGFNIFRGPMGLLMFPLSIFAAWWTYRDAQTRQLAPLLWAGISFSIFPLGFIAYLIRRTAAARIR